MIIPGSTEVIDRASGKLVACDANTCPHALEGVNHAVRRLRRLVGCDQRRQGRQDQGCRLRLPLLQGAAQQANEDVTIGITGFNPYRTSQFEDNALWIRPG